MVGIGGEVEKLRERERWGIKRRVYNVVNSSSGARGPTRRPVREKGWNPEKESRSSRGTKELKRDDTRLWNPCRSVLLQLSYLREGDEMK